MKYQGWREEDNDGIQDTFSTEENCKKYLAKGIVISNTAKLIFETEANSWTEAMTKWHEFNGWEPYKEMELK